MAAPGHILGLDIGGTKTAVVVGTRGGEVRHRVELPSGAARGFDAMFADLCRHVEDVLRRSASIDAIGVSIGGPLDAAEGVILSPPHLPGWNRIPLRALLEERFGLPVAIEHDAKAGALAEWMFGAGRGVRDLVFLTCGTGLGAGIIAGGRLIRGAGGGAGECGHWRIAPDGPPIHHKRGSWEGYASGAGIEALGREMAPGILGGASDIAGRARRGEPEAAAVIRRSGEHLGRGLALLVDLLAPEVIAIGTLAHHLGEMWLGPAREVVAAEALPELAARCRILPAALGASLGDVASLCPIIQREREEDITGRDP